MILLTKLINAMLKSHEYCPVVTHPRRLFLVWQTRCNDLPVDFGIGTSTSVVLLDYPFLLSRVTNIVYQVSFLLPFVCFSALYLKNRCIYRITKVDSWRTIQMFHDDSWKPIYFGVERSKVNVTSKPMWVFALLWLLASSG